MPIINDDEVSTYYDPVQHKQLKKQEIEQSPDILDTFASSFKKWNSISSAYDSITNGYDGDKNWDNQFDPFDPDYLKGYEQYSDQFIQAENKSVADHIKRQIDREKYNDEIRAKSGGWGITADIVANIADPITLAGTLLAPEITVPGKFLASAGKMAAFGAADQVTREFALHQTQKTRTLDESITNTVGATVLSGLLGGAVGSLTKQQFNQLANQTGQNITQPSVPAVPPVHQSAGAQAVKTTTLEQEQLLSAGKGAEKIAFTPTMRLANSPSKQARIAGQELATDALYRNKNVEGISTPHSAEIELQRLDTMRVDIRVSFKDNFKALKKGTIHGDDLADELEKAGLSIERQKVVQNPNKYINNESFNKLVANALRNGDRSAIPQVQAVAQTARSIFNNMIKQAVNARLISPEDLKVATSETYLTRVWNTNKVMTNRTLLKGKLESWVVRTQPELADEAQNIADAAINSILGNKTGINLSSYTDIVAKAGPLKARTLLIPDDEIKEFLEHDIISIIDRYIHSVGSESILARRFGSKDLVNIIEDIKSEYDDLINAAGGNSTKLENLRTRDIDDVTFLRDKFLGTADIPEQRHMFWARPLKSIRQYNVIDRLGAMTISSASDIFRPVMVHGFKRFGKSLATLLTDKSLQKMSTEEMNKLGVGLDLVLNSRMNAIASIGDDFGRNTKLERGLDEGSRLFSRLTLMQHWNTSWKDLSGIMTVDRILEHAPKWSSLAKKDKAFLAKIGIDEQMAERITQQYAQHGGEIKGLKIANLDKWTDLDAKYNFELSIIKTTEFTINTPKNGTLPKIMNNQIGKTIMQFKSFLFASHEQTIIAGLQMADSNFYLGMLGMVAMGGLVSQIKAILAGREPTRDPGQILYDAIDQSGVLSIPMEINNTLTGVGMKSPINGLLGIESGSRYRDRTFGDILGGPSGGTVQTGLELLKKGTEEIAGTKNGGFKKKDWKKVHSLLPGNNLYGLRPYQMIFDTREYFDRVNKALETEFGK